MYAEGRNNADDAGLDHAKLSGEYATDYSEACRTLFSIF